MTGDRQVQFSLNQDPARIYFLFLPWAEPVLNNSVSIYSKLPRLLASILLYSGSCGCLFLKKMHASSPLWLPVMSVVRKKNHLLICTARWQ